MTTFIITILIISQIVTFFIIYKRLKPKLIKQEGIVLKPLPKELTYNELDPDFNTVYDVLESIKIEGWQLEFEEEFSISGKSYSLNFQSHDSLVRVRSKIRTYDNKQDRDIYSMFYLITDGCSISIDNESPIKNDIVLFMWDYILEYHEGKKQESKEYYEDGIDKITSSLKTLNRSKKLNQIL